MNVTTEDPAPATMADVAISAGVHVSTVSRALRDDKKLPEGTRLRIKNIARDMGYRPNPLVAALIASRRSRHQPAFRATIGYVTLAGPAVPFFPDYEIGVRQAAGSLGFKVDAFKLGENGLDASRLNTVLRARNISTLVIGPMVRAKTTIKLDWSRLSAVAIGYGLGSPAIDRVVHDNYASMGRILTECARRGWKDIGIVSSARAHDRTERMITAAYWSRLEMTGFAGAIPPLIIEEWNNDAFNIWRKKHRPEVFVVTKHFQLHAQACLDSTPARNGGHVGLVSINTEDGGAVSGIFQDAAGVGATATRLVIAKAFRNEYGVPAAPQTVLTPGSWIKGTTLGFAQKRRMRSVRSA